jgi:uncharacterized protein (DUF1015 family)
MRLYAFEGLHYTIGESDPAAAGALCAQPYDQINTAQRDRYHAQSPHQFVHLTMPVPAGGDDQYRHAAALHAAWLADGTVARDERPALYPYVIELASGGRRLGVAGLAEIADATVIRPHEHTLDKPLADRLELLRATHVDLEPALLLSEDGGALDLLIAEDTATAKPLVDHVDSEGHHHLLYRVDDPGRIARYRDVVSGPAAIADGHHRYKVAGRFAKESGAAAGTAAGAKLAIVTSLDSPALTIDPIHRALVEKVDLDRLAAHAVSRTPWEGTGGAAFAAAVAAAPQPALGIQVGGRTSEIWQLDPSQAPESVATGARTLAVTLLHEVLFPTLGLTPAAATDGTVIYRSDPDVLDRMVSAGEAGTGLYLPPMAPAEFAAAIAHGDMLAPKSTRFLPKVMSGLVWADHTSRVL